MQQAEQSHRGKQQRATREHAKKHGAHLVDGQKTLEILFDGLHSEDG